MVNKNNKIDLVKFFFWSGGIIFGIIVFIAYGFLLLDGKYFRELDARVSNYIQQRWNAQP